MPKCTGYRLLSPYQIWPSLGLSGTEADVHIDVRTGVVQIDSGRPSVGSVVETRTPERQPTAPIKWPFPYKNAAILPAALFTFVLFLARLPVDVLFIVPDLPAQVVYQFCPVFIFPHGQTWPFVWVHFFICRQAYEKP